MPLAFPLSAQVQSRLAPGRKNESDIPVDFALKTRSEKTTLPPPPEEVQRILVVKLRAIGDVLLSTPVLENLRQAYPEAAVDFLTEPECAPLLRTNPAVDEVLLFDRKAVQESGPLKAGRMSWKLLTQVRRRKYDLVIDLFGNPRSALVSAFSGAKWRVGFDWRGRRLAYNVVAVSRADEVHEVDFNLDALRTAGLPVRAREPRVFTTDDAEEEADAFFNEEGLKPGEVVALNPAGGWPTKRWPVNRFAELARRVVEELRHPVLVLWGPGELDAAREIASRSGVSVRLLPQTDLLGLAAYLRRCALLVTNDSGPMHLAAAVGTPVVAIFGPTNPDLQGPFGAGHRVVRAEELTCLGCNLTLCRHRSCMVMVDVGRVLETVAEGLRSVPLPAEEGSA